MNELNVSTSILRVPVATGVVAHLWPGTPRARDVAVAVGRGRVTGDRFGVPGAIFGQCTLLFTGTVSRGRVT